MSFDLHDFETEVLEASNATPIVIDFWAEWCGPCRQLGPVLEKLAGQAGGRWKLVKVDTDSHPDLAIQFNVRGIPAVKMLYQGEVIAEFTGALPEHQVKQWLDQNLPDTGSSNELLEQVSKFLGEGNRGQALAYLKDHISESEQPTDDIMAKMAMLLLPEQIEEAGQWMAKLEDSIPYDIQQQTLDTVTHLKDLFEDENDASLNGRGKAGELYREAAEKLLDGNFTEALPLFIESLQLDRMIDDDGPRKACIACFTMLGEHHPLSVKYRRPFSMSLY